MTTTNSTHTVYRTCPLCEAKCGISVETEVETGRVLRIRGDDEDPLSHGYICPKSQGLRGLQEDPDRLIRPQLRTGSRWQEIPWDEAIELAVAGLRAIRERYGPNANATYLGNPNAHDVAAAFYGPAFQRALGTRWRFSATSVDQLPKMLSQSWIFGHPASFAVPDVDRTAFFLVLGANPLVSNGSLMTAPDMRGRLRRLRKRGGRLVVVDPRRSETAAVADQHIFIRPGSDALFLFALVHTLFAEQLVDLGHLEPFTDGVAEVEGLAREFSPEAVAGTTGIDPGTIRSLAREFAAAPSAVCYGRIGTCTQEFGTLASWLVDVVNVLTGNLDRAGGAMFPRSSVGPAELKPRQRGKNHYGRWHSRVRQLPEFSGEIPAAALAEEIDTEGDGQVRGLVTVAGNPVLSTPNGARLAAALENLDFMVSVDIYRNETTRFADLILPTTTHLEHSNFDIFFQALSVHNGTKWSPANLSPPPDGRHLWQVLLDLAAGLTDTSAAALDELILTGLLRSTVGMPESACPEVSEEQARAILGGEPGPERLIDLLLRAGPYGDRFDSSSDGLSLPRLKASPHGIDLGPLTSQLPDRLATASGSIELAPEPLVADVARLRAHLASEQDASKLVLIGRRSVRSNNSWMHNLELLTRGRDRCTLLMNPEDARRLGIDPSGKARIRSRAGEVTAPVTVSDEMMAGVVSLPHGFGHDEDGVELRVASRQAAGVNSNLLTDEDRIDTLSGNAVLNGIPVEVAPV